MYCLIYFSWFNSITNWDYSNSLFFTEILPIAEIIVSASVNIFLSILSTVNTLSLKISTIGVWAWNLIWYWSNNPVGRYKDIIGTPPVEFNFRFFLFSLYHVQKHHKYQLHNRHWNMLDINHIYVFLCWNELIYQSLLH